MIWRTWTPPPCEHMVWVTWVGGRTHWKPWSMLCHTQHCEIWSRCFLSHPDLLLDLPSLGETLTASVKLRRWWHTCMKGLFWQHHNPPSHVWWTRRGHSTPFVNRLFLKNICSNDLYKRCEQVLTFAFTKNPNLSLTFFCHFDRTAVKMCWQLIWQVLFHSSRFCALICSISAF